MRKASAFLEERRREKVSASFWAGFGTGVAVPLAMSFVCTIVLCAVMPREYE